MLSLLKFPQSPTACKKTTWLQECYGYTTEGKHPPKHPRLNCYLQESLTNESQVDKGGGEKAKHASFTLS